jgi:hypothetical protein
VRSGCDEALLVCRESFGVLQKLRNRRDVASSSPRWRLVGTVSLAIQARRRRDATAQGDRVS